MSVDILRLDYDFEKFGRDIIAGLTVAIVALPLAMALAIASGTTPDKGLVTAVVVGFLIPPWAAAVSRSAAPRAPSSS